MQRNVWRKNWADSFFTYLDRSKPCQWKQQFEDTWRKCNSRKKSRPSIRVLAKCRLAIDRYVHWLLVDISANMLINILTLSLATCLLFVDCVLANMLTDQVYPPIVSTNTWPRGAQISQDLYPIQNYHPRHLGNLVVLDQVVPLTGANLWPKTKIS